MTDARIEVVRRTTLSAGQAWERLTAWERHGEFLPLTKVHVDADRRGEVGACFVARTSLGRLGFDDPMEVTSWRPPGAATPGLVRIVKRGRVVVGWAVLTVTPVGPGALVEWTEHARFRAAGPFLDGPTRVVGRRVFGRLVEGLLADRPT
ncbi:MAG: SRPBCC family protein [Actinomycetota bacterium]|nr:SRPBCC family protein [Actinomycetota bacterium]